MHKEVMLTMVSENNNNKFYRMIPSADGNYFVAEYGRIGCANPQRRTYPIWQYSEKYDEKINKGYRDVTHLMGSKSEHESASAALKDGTEAQKLIAMLMDYADVAYRNTYSVDLKNVTEEMLREAESLVNVLRVMDSKRFSVADFNETLCNLYTVIPRVMKDTRVMMASSKDDFAAIVTREREYLDNLKGLRKVYADVPAKTDEGKEGKNSVLEKIDSVIEKHGLEIQPCTDKDIALIKSQMGASALKFSRAWVVINKNTRKAFGGYVAKKDIGARGRKLLWHGSRNCNWLNILSLGLLLNPKAQITGKMFGRGIYFAPSYDKSEGYTSLNGSRWANGSEKKGYLALMNVAVGKHWDVHAYSSEAGDMDAKAIAKKGYDSLWAHSDTGMLRADEIVVYDEAAVDIQYLVEVTL